MKRIIANIILFFITTFFFVGCVSKYISYKETETTSYYPIFIAKYSISLWRVESPEKSSERYGIQKVDTISQKSEYNYSFEDDNIKILWIATSRNISFYLQNKTDHSIKIPWDEAAYVDENGFSHRVMHSGIKYIDKDKTMPPTVIVRKGFIKDIVFPTDYVYYDEGNRSYISDPSSWEKKVLLLDYRSQYGESNVSQEDYSRDDSLAFEKFNKEVKLNIGKNYQVLLPLQIKDEINEYIFIFNFDDVTTKQDSLSY